MAVERRQAGNAGDSDYQYIGTFAGDMDQRARALSRWMLGEDVGSCCEGVLSLDKAGVDGLNCRGRR